MRIFDWIEEKSIHSNQDIQSYPEININDFDDAGLSTWASQWSVATVATILPQNQPPTTIVHQPQPLKLPMEARNFEDRVKNIPKSSRTLKAFFWTKMTAAQIKGTFWERLNFEGWLQKIGPERIDRLFAVDENSELVS